MACSLDAAQLVFAQAFCIYIGTGKTRGVLYRASLPGVDVDELVEREPMVFSADVPRVLADVKRLLGSRMDPVKYFVANPRQVLDMQQGGMPSSAETGGDHDG